ncbi:ankyrin repeat domain-containing protein 27-like [Artemia franciscana]|uniref:VPS9 domain-containing protein n=1 Tax=Artemia franciscana TaxID=6661 RepID=A0AA88HRL8_ARTSF|nr:hypothetical protein QYM36_008857 [Artemia franciscana]
MDVLLHRLVDYIQAKYPLIFNQILEEHWHIYVSKPEIEELSELSNIVSKILILDNSGAIHTFSEETCGYTDKNFDFKSCSIESEEKYYVNDGQHCSFIFLHLNSVSVNSSELDDPAERSEIQNSIFSNKKIRAKVCGFKKKLESGNSSFTETYVLVQEYVNTVAFSLKILEAKLRKNKCELSYNEKLRLEKTIYKLLQPELFDSIVVINSRKEELLNKMRKSISHLDLEQVHVQEELHQRIIPTRSILNKLQNADSPFNKIAIICQALKLLTSSILPLHKNALTDDILAAFIFCIQSSSIVNWASQFETMRHFITVELDSEQEYYLSTLEASLEYLNNIPTTLVSTLPKELLNFQAEWSGCEECHPLCVCELKRNEMELIIHSFLGNVEKVQNMLINKQLNVRFSDSCARTALHYAAKMGHQNVLLMLAYASFDINALDAERWTPLHYASDMGHKSCVKALIYYAESAANPLQVNVMTYQGETPLHLAAKGGYTSIVECLLKHGASNKLRNRSGKTASDLTVFPHLKQILKTHDQKQCSLENFEIISYNKKQDLQVMHEPDIESNGDQLSQDNHGELHALDHCVKKAIKDNDTNLLKYYLSIDCEIETEYLCDKELKEKNKCHPLCLCQNCYDLTVVSRLRVTRKPNYTLSQSKINEWIEFCRQLGKKDFELLFLQLL